jgi:hypothetical protein
MPILLRPELRSAKKRITVIVLVGAGVLLLVAGMAAYFHFRSPLLATSEGAAIDAMLRTNIDPQYRLIRWWPPRELPELDREMLQEPLDAKAQMEETVRQMKRLGVGKPEEMAEIERSSRRTIEALDEQINLIRAAQPIRYCRIKYHCKTVGKAGEDSDGIYWVYSGKVHRVLDGFAERFKDHFE